MFLVAAVVFVSFMAAGVEGVDASIKSQVVAAIRTGTRQKSGALGMSSAIPLLSPEKCATLSNSPPAEPILEKERCSVCELIVENSRQWNWIGHYASMCEGVPPHAQEWCEYYACKMAECGFFRSNTCKVIDSVDQKSVVQMNPCPAKYLCSYCLQVPRTQVFGCFDETTGN
jgi:hypothetical protein